MKVSLGLNLQKGPYGGGNQVARAVVEHLENKGVTVRFDLKDKDLDLIMLFDPRKNLRISAYNHKDILRHLWFKNSKAVVVHRINECDERKGQTDGKTNDLLITANACADHTIFISSFLQQLYTSQGIQTPGSTVIRIGVNPAIFHPEGYLPWDGVGPLKLITHHWGAHWMKGFDVYQRLDEMMAERPGRIEFTYVGNIPADFRFKKATHIEPKNGPELADILRAHHVYVTGTQNEPAGLHHAEGAMCGLPLLYRQSGALPEYCTGFGLGFTTVPEFEQRLEEMTRDYGKWREAVKAYPRDAEARMCEQYLALFQDLVARGEELRGQRRFLSQPMRYLRALTT